MKNYDESRFNEDGLEILEKMSRKMRSEEKSSATISKYLRDTRSYLDYAGVSDSGFDICLDPDMAGAYKEHLNVTYKATSVNSMLAGVNYFFRFCGRSDLRMKAHRIQRASFRQDEKELTVEEYHRLIRTAEESGRIRLSMIMQTLGSTGMRVSELPFVTVEAIESRCADVILKGKIRHVLLPESLCVRLRQYAASRGITEGCIFITRNGKPVDRNNILHDMKKLCEDACVDPRKVYPHNLRHMFAVAYYDKYRDVFRLADILGHSNINTTRIYTTVSSDDLARSIESLQLLYD